MERFAMPKVYGLHEIELQPGVEPDEISGFSPNRSYRRP